METGTQPVPAPPQARWVEVQLASAASVDGKLERWMEIAGEDGRGWVKWEDGKVEPGFEQHSLLYINTMAETLSPHTPFHWLQRATPVPPPLTPLLPATASKG